MLGDDPYGWRLTRLLGRRTGGRELADLGRQAGRIALEHEQRDLVEHRLHGGGIERIAARERDLVGGRGLGALEGVEQVLVQLLARSAAHDLDGDVAPRSSPDSSIMSRASCMIDTASPICRTNSSPPSPSEPARMTSCTASGMVMK